MGTEPITKQTELKQYMERAQPQLLAVLPDGVGLERIVRCTLLAAAQNPDILDCTKESVLMSVMECCRLGFEPGGPLGHAYLVPFKNVCTMILGYKGMIVLATRNGRINGMEARAVMAGDEFEICYGTAPVLMHVPKPGPANRAVIGAYAIARLVADATQFEYVDDAQIDAARRRSRGRAGPWSTDYAAMAAKTAVRRLSKFLPLGDTTHRAIAEDTAREFEPDTYMDREETARNWREVLAERAAILRNREDAARIIGAPQHDAAAEAAEMHRQYMDERYRSAAEIQADVEKDAGK